MPKDLIWFNEISSKDISIVGGKNSSLGEMIRIGLPVPEGFAVTSHAYKKFIEENNLDDFIEKELKEYNNDMKKLDKISKSIQDKICSSHFPKDMEDSIMSYYQKLCEISGEESVRCAVRSSATAEDLPTASFAGQQDTFLNVNRDEILEKIKHCFSSLFNSRAIFYRKEKGFGNDIQMSVGVQRLINSDKSGVMFTVEPNSGNNNIMVIDSSYGLGELIVSGSIIPDQFYIFKPITQIIRKRVSDKKNMLVADERGTKSVTISDNMRILPSLAESELKKLAEYGINIQKHYMKNMDIEWAIEKNKTYILQARPETIYSNFVSEDTYKLLESGKELLKGIAVGKKIAHGKVKILHDPQEMHKFEQGDILVTKMTTPNWVPIMNRASAIITEEGGTTSHAAIVSRELGIPCIVGASDAIKILENHKGKNITLDCSEGIGIIYDGKLEFKKESLDLKKLPKTRTQIMMNISIPDAALPHANKCDGVGLLRMEFVYANEIGIHPLALINYKRLKEITNDAKITELVKELEKKTKGYENKEEFFLDKLTEGISVIAAAVYPNDVVIRFSDFKTNEYRDLLGGYLYENEEANPMLGWRGASRYVHPDFEAAFRLECKSIKATREKGLKNVIPMIPFCRSVKELEKILKIMEEEGLKRSNGLKVYVMAELPANIWNAEEFAQHIDGFSIGSNDLTQLTLGVDRDSGSLAGVNFDERDTAVKKSISHLIQTAHQNGKKVGICGQAPSDYPDFVEFLIKEGIDSISLNPDVLGKTRKLVADIEDKLMITPVNFKDSIVFLRTDMSSPIDATKKKLLNEYRVMDGVNAIKWCFDNGSDSVVVMSHQRSDTDSLELHSRIIEKYFPGKFFFIKNISDIYEKIKNSDTGSVFLLENLRKMDEERNYSDVTQTTLYNLLKKIEKDTNKNIIYAKDDLAVSHRKDLSVYALPMRLKSEGYEIVAGQLIRNEIVRAKKAREKMEKRKVICLWGGSKLDDFLNVLEPFLINYKNSIILTAGPLAMLMLKSLGKEIGENEKIFGITKDMVSKTYKILDKYPDRIMMPKDFYVETESGKEVVSSGSIKGIIVDIGPETVESYKNILKTPDCIILGNGPLGEYEKINNAKGTIQVYTEVFNPMNRHFIIGTGSNFNMMCDVLGFQPDMRSSGGQAFLELLVSGKLPGLESLDLSID